MLTTVALYSCEWLLERLQATLERFPGGDSGRPLGFQPALRLGDQKRELTENQLGRLSRSFHRLDPVEPGDYGTRFVHELEARHEGTVALCRICTEVC